MKYKLKEEEEANQHNITNKNNDNIYDGDVDAVNIDYGSNTNVEDETDPHDLVEMLRRNTRNMLNEVSMFGQELHGNNSNDWIKLSRLRNFDMISRHIDDDIETDDFQVRHAGEDDVELQKLEDEKQSLLDNNETINNPYYKKLQDKILNNQELTDGESEMFALLSKKERMEIKKIESFFQEVCKKPIGNHTNFQEWKIDLYRCQDALNYFNMKISRTKEIHKEHMSNPMFLSEPMFRNIENRIFNQTMEKLLNHKKDAKILVDYCKENLNKQYGKHYKY